MRFSLLQVVILIFIFFVLFSTNFVKTKKLVELVNQFFKKIGKK